MTNWIERLVGLLTTIDTVVDAIKVETDKLPSAIHYKPQWSQLPIVALALSNAAADRIFSSVTFPAGFLPAGATVQAIYLMEKFNERIDSSGGANALTAQKTIRVMKNGGAWGTNDIVGLTLANGQLATALNAIGSGDILIGDVDVKSEVDDVDNQQYDIRSEETTRSDSIVVTAASLTLVDVYSGFMVFYTL